MWYFSIIFSKTMTPRLGSESTRVSTQYNTTVLPRQPRPSDGLLVLCQVSNEDENIPILQERKKKKLHHRTSFSLARKNK